MHLDECYRVLDLDRRATEEEIRHAHRDLTKVWHPDRFGHDAALRRKAEEKLKAINEAYETIRASHPRQDQDDDRDDTPHWRIRWRGREMRAGSLQEIVTLVDRGRLGEETEVFDPGAGRWLALTEIPELRAVLSRRRVRRNRTYAFTCALIAIFILLRRPTPAGLVIGLVLFVVAFVFVLRMRASGAVR